MKNILSIKLSIIFFIFSKFLFAQDINVTLSVDMNEVDTHPDGVFLAGGQFGQDGLAMDDSDGDDSDSDDSDGDSDDDSDGDDDSDDDDVACSHDSDYSDVSYLEKY